MTWHKICRSKNIPQRKKRSPQSLKTNLTCTLGGGAIRIQMYVSHFPFKKKKIIRRGGHHICSYFYYKNSLYLKWTMCATINFYKFF